jgi:hypothetical protein
VELAQAISEVLAQALVQAHELAELVEDRIGRRRGLRALLGAEPGDGERIGPVGLRTTQVLLCEAPYA